MVLVPVGRDAAVDAVRVLAQVREVGEDEVDAGHVGLWEHEAAVEEHDAPVDLDAGAVPPDLAEPSEEDDADRVSHGARAAGPSDAPQVVDHLPRPLFSARRRRPERRPALAHRMAEHAHHRLRRDRVRSVVARLERVGLEETGVRLTGPDDIALLERRDHLAVLDP